MIINTLLAIIVPLFLTIIIESAVACLFFRSNYDLEIVVLVQCITNPIVNLLIVLYEYFWATDLVLVVILLEICAIIAEALIYRKYLSEKNKNKAVPLSLVANVVAFVVGYVVLPLI